MSTPAKDPELLKVWRKLENQYRGQGFSRVKSWTKIGEEYGVSPYTVRYWLDENRRGRSRTGRYQREPNRREYDKSYKWFTRHLSQYIPQAFEGYERLSTKELSDELAEVAGSDPKVGRDIHLQEETLKKHIQELEEGLPLTELESGVYRWEGEEQ